MAMKVALSFLILLLGQSVDYLTENLEQNCKVLIDGRFVSFHKQDVNGLYVSIDFKKHSQKTLRLSNSSEVYLYFNSNLIAKAKQFEFSADSLAKIFPNPVFVCVFSPRGVANAKLNWIVATPGDLFSNINRAKSGFNNFLIAASFLLLSFFTVLLRTNPQLTLDYLNVIKMVSFQRRDEVQFTLRITSSVNLLIYIFSSLLVSLAFIVSFYHVDSYFNNPHNSFLYFFTRWILGGAVCLALLAFKLALSTIFSRLFNWREASGFQFFNFVRTLVVSLIAIGCVTIFLSALHFELNYYFLMKIFFTLLVIEPILMFFKLMTRESVKPFHLFSYLCATEIFPLIILIKFFLF